MSKLEGDVRGTVTALQAQSEANNLLQQEVMSLSVESRRGGGGSGPSGLLNELAAQVKRARGIPRAPATCSSPRDTTCCAWAKI